MKISLNHAFVLFLIALCVGLSSCYMDPPPISVGNIKNESSKNLIIRLSDEDSIPDNIFLGGQIYYVGADSLSSLYVPFMLDKPKKYLWYFDFYDRNIILDFFNRQKNGVKFRTIINKSFLKRIVITQDEFEKKEIKLVYKDTLLSKR